MKKRPKISGKLSKISPVYIILGGGLFTGVLATIASFPGVLSHESTVWDFLAFMSGIALTIAIYPTIKALKDASKL